jgi:hypothetical protein
LPTRADFYVGEGPDADWLGSIAFDGYAAAVDMDAPRIFAASTEAEYRNAVSQFLVERDDATMPEEGWPWPWETSGATCCAYTWMDGHVWGSSMGRPWFLIQDDLDCYGEPRDPSDEPEMDPDREKKIVRGAPVFPNMRDRTHVRWDRGPGLTVVVG